MFGGTSLLAIFTTGLLTGSLTCVAVQGGLLTAFLSQRESSFLKEKIKKENIQPILAFIITKLVVYTILGFLLGWIGSLFQVSITIRIFLQLAVVIFMLGTALNLLDVHPIFRYFVIISPKSLLKIVDNTSRVGDNLAPILLGLFTVFIPCGATQAMMALAVATGNPILGAIILFVFVLGTSPVFFLLGYITLKLGTALKKNFMRIAAVIIILFALFNLDATLALANSPYTISTILRNGYCIVSYCVDPILQLSPVTEQTITFTPDGYSPNIFVVNRGSTVTLHLVNKNVTGCIQAFTMSALNIQKVVLPNQSADISFVAPNKQGRINFTCSAGLYPGRIEVI